MSAPRRIYIRCRWENVPAEETHRTSKVTKDFCAKILQREYSGSTDWVHQSPLFRGYCYLALDLNCHKAIQDLEQLPYQSYVVAYNDGDNVEFSRATLRSVHHYGKLFKWGWDRSLYFEAEGQPAKIETSSQDDDGHIAVGKELP